MLLRRNLGILMYLVSFKITVKISLPDASIEVMPYNQYDSITSCASGLILGKDKLVVYGRITLSAVFQKGYVEIIIGLNRTFITLCKMDLNTCIDHLNQDCFCWCNEERNISFAINITATTLLDQNKLSAKLYTKNKDVCIGSQVIQLPAISKNCSRMMLENCTTLVAEGEMVTCKCTLSRSASNKYAVSWNTSQHQLNLKASATISFIARIPKQELTCVAKAFQGTEYFALVFLPFVVSKIHNVSCDANLHHNGSANISCTTGRIYPRAKCKFFQYTDNKPRTQLVNVSYKHTIVSRHPLYYKTQCGMQLKDAHLETNALNVTAYLYPEHVNITHSSRFAIRRTVSVDVTKGTRCCALPYYAILGSPWLHIS
ncbi:serine-rich adhesin for platelets [Biomphalaria glabrata]|nr:hypothetical protein BgiMline_019818 [Biomphalaria glabrata]